MAIDIFQEFFTKDNEIDTISGKRRISSLLSIKRDLRRIMVDSKNNMGLSFLTNISLICTCVDLLSKVSIAREPNRGENGQIFKDYLKKYCNFSEEEAISLWKLRNTTLHSFKIDSVKGIILYGTNSPVLISNKGQQKQITFNLRRLYSCIVINSPQKLKDDLLLNSNIQSHKNYIEKNGFYYRS